MHARGGCNAKASQVTKSHPKLWLFTFHGYCYALPHTHFLFYSQKILHLTSFGPDTKVEKKIGSLTLHIFNIVFMKKQEPPKNRPKSSYSKSSSF